MDFNHRTGSAKDSPTQESDTALTFVKIIEAMTPVECLKFFSQPLFYANFCLQLMPPGSIALSFTIRQPLINN